MRRFSINTMLFVTACVAWACAASAAFGWRDATGVALFYILPALVLFLCWLVYRHRKRSWRERVGLAGEPLEK